MDASTGHPHPRTRPVENQAPRPDIAPELDAWFTVSGDMDDFIYYGDNPKPHSER